MIAARVILLAGSVLAAAAERFKAWSVKRSKSEKPASLAPKIGEPLRLSLAEQWAKVSAIVLGASAKADEASKCHSSAAMQLDLAQYGLTSLLAELTIVMDVGVRPMPATVHVLRRPKAKALAGAMAA
jgi:hypothetical protein